MQNCGDQKQNYTLSAFMEKKQFSVPFWTWPIPMECRPTDEITLSSVQDKEEHDKEEYFRPLSLNIQAFFP
jgi:hypothetical protein